MLIRGNDLATGLSLGADGFSDRQRWSLRKVGMDGIGRCWKGRAGHESMWVMRDIMFRFARLHWMDVATVWVMGQSTLSYLLSKKGTKLPIFC